MKATEHSLPVVLLIMQYKLVARFVNRFYSVHEIL